MYITRINDQYQPFGSGLHRTPGLHLTSIIKSLRNDLGLGKTAAGWEMSVCADLGFLWEEAFSLAYTDRAGQVIHGITRPGEITRDGIIMSPDGIGLDPAGKIPFVNHELKCTWRSLNNNPQDDFYWDTQFKCYCKGLETTVTILHVMYVVGNYRGSGPRPDHVRFEYTQKEINTAWDMVVRHAKEKGWLP